MGELADKIRAALYSTNPYDGFDYKRYPRDLQGGSPVPMMRDAFNATKPRIIVEVGTWKGASACLWASLLREAGIDGAVICIDTWLGSLEHLRAGPMLHAEQWDLNHYRKHGYPTLYHQFLANVMHEGLQEFIVPIPNTSAIGARWLAAQRLPVHMLYIDASHDEHDVMADLRAYWPLLCEGGVMLGDDWSPAWPGVVSAVNRFAEENSVQIQSQHGTWAFQKPSAS